MIEWKGVRITKDAWKEVRKALAEYEVDMDDFISYVLCSLDLEEIAGEYDQLPDLEEEEESESEEKI